MATPGSTSMPAGDSLPEAKARAFRTSMECGVKAYVENYMTGIRRHVSSAYLTFVAVDHSGGRLPVPPLVPDTAEEKERSTTGPISGHGRVLIVDDEEAIRDLVEFTLTHLGYSVSTAETALAGVELYRQKFQAGERFDLVILDLTLPGGMGGKEALKHLIEIDPGVNAIVSSGYATDATMSRYQDFGFRGVIAKPYEANELGRIVHDVIESSHEKTTSDQRLCTAG